ncbi:MAG: class I SAM-dependent methyltransferase [Acidobacteriota bacterium]
MEPYDGHVLVDVGTGDGRFVYRSALRAPEKFFIGIDANARSLARLSEKIYRRPAKGGAPNVLFLQAAAQQFPEELRGIASEVVVQFPWGSLLRGVAAGDELVLENLRKLCRTGARLEVIIGIDTERDRSQIARLELPELSDEYLKRELVPAYESRGFEIEEYSRSSASSRPEIDSSWARKLRQRSTRVLIFMRGRAI